MIDGVFGGARNGGSDVLGGARGCGGVPATVVVRLRSEEEVVEKVVVAAAAAVGVVAALDIFFFARKGIVGVKKWLVENTLFRRIEERGEN
jgi:hypothetical protein